MRCPQNFAILPNQLVLSPQQWESPQWDVKHEFNQSTNNGCLDLSKIRSDFKQFYFFIDLEHLCAYGL